MKILLNKKEGFFVPSLKALKKYLIKKELPFYVYYGDGTSFCDIGGTYFREDYSKIKEIHGYENKIYLISRKDYGVEKHIYNSSDSDAFFNDCYNIDEILFDQMFLEIMDILGNEAHEPGRSIPRIVEIPDGVYYYIFYLAGQERVIYSKTQIYNESGEEVGKKSGV